MDITKVVIPAAGLGTRFLPLTKAIPKEMLPLLSKPAIHYIVEEALDSAITNFFIITGKGKNALADYFDASPDLEALLCERNKLSVMQELDRMRRQAFFSYIRQSEPLGLGHAVLMAKQVIGKEYFGIMLPDDIMVSSQPGLAQLIRIARQEKGTVIAVQEVPSHAVSAYGVISIKKQITPSLFQVSGLVEKPQPKDAPSQLAVVGRYVMSHKIFASLEHVGAYATSELQLTDGISHMLHNGERVFAYKVPCARYDIGNPLGWLKTNIALALQHPEYGNHLRLYLQSFAQQEMIQASENIKNLE